MDFTVKLCDRYVFLVCDNLETDVPKMPRSVELRSGARASYIFSEASNGLRVAKEETETSSLASWLMVDAYNYYYFLVKKIGGKEVCILG